MPAVVTFLHSFQYVIRIICLEVIVALDNAFLGPFRRSVHLLVRTLRRVNQRGPDTLMRLDARVMGLHIFLVCSPCGKGTCGLEKPEN
jgi:hypothetical protein